MINVGQISLDCMVQLNSIYVIPLFPLQPTMSSQGPLSNSSIPPVPISLFHRTLWLSAILAKDTASKNFKMSFSIRHFLNVISRLELFPISRATWARSISLLALISSLWWNSFLQCYTVRGAIHSYNWWPTLCFIFFLELCLGNHLFSSLILVSSYRFDSVPVVVNKCTTKRCRVIFVVLAVKHW